jgi:hypothetical protein
VWIWDRSTRRAERFPGVIARPLFGFEVVRWSADGRRLLCKIVPSGMLAAINALDTPLDEQPRFQKDPPGTPSVIVQRSAPREPKATAKPTREVPSKPVGDTGFAVASLAILDLDTKAVTRLVENEPVRFYAFSPDGKSVAYTVLQGWEADSQQPRTTALTLRTRCSRRCSGSASRSSTASTAARATCSRSGPTSSTSGTAGSSSWPRTST